MESDEREPWDVARSIADTFEAHEIPYALGGAMAYGYWGVLRATHDVDFNVFVGAADVQAVFDSLTQAGVQIERRVLDAAAKEGGYARGWLGLVAIDVFFNSIPLHEAAARRTVIRELQGRAVHVLSAEDITVLKLLFYRTKDIADVERIVATQGGALDRAYVRQWLLETVGEDDVRVSRWDELTRALPPTPPA